MAKISCYNLIMTKEFKLFSDGAARGNPGPAGIGVIIKQGGKTLLEAAEYLGKTTNNIAEYLALIRGLEESLLLGIKTLTAYSDSELLVKQLNGEYRVKNEGLSPLYHHVKSLSKKFTSLSICYLARGENRAADKLANQGIDQHCVAGSPLFDENAF